MGPFVLRACLVAYSAVSFLAVGGLHATYFAGDGVLTNTNAKVIESTTNLAAGPDFDYLEATAAEGFGDKNVGGGAWSVRFESLYSPTHDAEHTFRAHVSSANEKVSVGWLTYRALQIACRSIDTCYIGSAVGR